MVLLPYFPHTHHQHCNHHLLPLTHRNRLDQPFSVLNGGKSVECVILTQEKPPHIKIEFLYLALAWPSAVSMTIINSMTTGMTLPWPSALPLTNDHRHDHHEWQRRSSKHRHSHVAPLQSFPKSILSMNWKQQNANTGSLKKYHYSTCCQKNQEWHRWGRRDIKKDCARHQV